MRHYVGTCRMTRPEQELRQLSKPFGQVKAAKIIMDRETGQPRGFGFVEMPVR